MKRSELRQMIKEEYRLKLPKTNTEAFQLYSSFVYSKLDDLDIAPLSATVNKILENMRKDADKIADLLKR